jgi:hypothetical protein
MKAQGGILNDQDRIDHQRALEIFNNAAANPSPAAQSQQPAPVAPAPAFGTYDNPHPPEAADEDIQPGHYYRDTEGNVYQRKAY